MPEIKYKYFMPHKNMVRNKKYMPIQNSTTYFNMSNGLH